MRSKKSLKKRSRKVAKRSLSRSYKKLHKSRKVKGGYYKFEDIAPSDSRIQQLKSHGNIILAIIKHEFDRIPEYKANTEENKLFLSNDYNLKKTFKCALNKPENIFNTLNIKGVRDTINALNKNNEKYLEDYNEYTIGTNTRYYTGIYLAKSSAGENFIVYKHTDDLVDYLSYISSEIRSIREAESYQLKLN